MPVSDERIRALLCEHDGPAYPVAPRVPRRRRGRAWVFAVAALALLLVPAAGISHGLIAALHFEHQRAPFAVFSGTYARSTTQWERLPLRRGAIEARITGVDVHSSTWHIRAELVNDSPYQVVVHRGRSWTAAGLPLRIVGFGVAFQPSREVFVGGSLSYRLTSVAATSFSSALPRRIAPHGHWSGTFSGYALLPRGRPIYVTFGGFEAQGEWPAERGYFFNGLPIGTARARVTRVHPKALISAHPFTLP